MNSRTLSLILVVFSLMVLVFSGCGKSGDTPVATVGDYDITMDEFSDYFTRANMSFANAQEEYNKKREILDSMIVTRLLIQGAYEKNVDKVEELARAVAANKDKFLISTLYKLRIADKAEPTEAEIKDFYNHLEYKVRAAHIVVSELDTAQALFERVKSGENFEQLAFEYSIDPDAKRNKGDLGYFLWGATVDEFQDAAFAMQPGEISPPIKSQFGYHVIKLIDKIPNDSRGEYGAMKDAIKNQIMRRKAMDLTREYFEVLKGKYPITVDTSTCDYVLHKREQVYPPQLLPTLPRNDFDLEQLDRNEKELVVASWSGGQVSLMQYLTQIKNIPANFRPDFDNYDSIGAVAFELLKPDMLKEEALAEGMDKNDEYLENMRMFKEFNMADIMKNDSIQAPPPPDEDALRAYYDEHIDEFTTPAKVHVYEIMLSDEMRATRLLKEIKSLDMFKQAAAELTERPGRRSRQGDMGFIEAKWYPELFEAAMKTSKGRMGGPVMVGGKYSIYWVVDKVEPEVRDFLEVKRLINDRLTKQAKGEAIQAWVDERLKNTNVEVDEDAIWATIEMDKYPEPVAGADSTAGN
ncbi:MAG: peptidylprolyl isomerase [Candidatus Zixiibacteriota bacterium]